MFNFTSEIITYSNSMKERGTPSSIISLKVSSRLILINFQDIVKVRMEKEETLQESCDEYGLYKRVISDTFDNLQSKYAFVKDEEKPNKPFTNVFEFVTKDRVY